MAIVIFAASAVTALSISRALEGSPETKPIWLAIAIAGTVTVAIAMVH